MRHDAVVGKCRCQCDGDDHGDGSRFGFDSVLAHTHQRGWPAVSAARGRLQPAVPPSAACFWAPRGPMGGKKAAATDDGASAPQAK
eukprot:4332500-Pyramimonas_sp.AAC.1